jgi:hypothetical protein
MLVVISEPEPPISATWYRPTGESVAAHNELIRVMRGEKA